MQTIGQRVRYLRSSQNLSMEELGKKIDSNSATISNIENDKSIPGGKILIALSEFFGVTTDYILKGTDPVSTAGSSPFFFQEKWEKNYHPDQTKVERGSVQALLEIAATLDDQDVNLLTVFAKRLKGSYHEELAEGRVMMEPTK
jgi:transcriptional regulator with XRE-family HTH domain